MKSINIKNARLHNLKGIDISIPKNKLVVATGVSGSGKSSLVFDIIFEEGRRQYLQSLGVLAKIDEEEKFDSITGISPAIAVQQNIIRQSNPRSTVGSRTGILNLLALLYAGDGRISCSACGSPVEDDLTCGGCGNTEERLFAGYFSYISPNGMCMKCSGRGAYFEINMEKLAPHSHTTLEQVIDNVRPTPGYANLLKRKFAEHLDTPFSKLTDDLTIEILYGHHVNSNYAKQSACITRILEGHLRKFGKDPNGIYTMSRCSECHGFRVGEEARRVYLTGRHIGELAMMTVAETHSFLENILKQNKLSGSGKRLLKEILGKTENLMKARLGHLSLYREMPTLSGGEIQRLFLNSHLDSKMDSLIYILDEPTIGLHESDKNDLMKSITALKELGNTVIVVEHDRTTIEMAEHIIDMGPKAGINGGQVIYQGGLAGLLKCETSVTGRYLSGEAALPLRTGIMNVTDNTPCLRISHVRTNNLKDVTVSFPLGGIVGIAGVSGSGKTSLISDTLVPLLKGFFKEGWDVNGTGNGENEEDTTFAEIIEAEAERLDGVEHISGYVEVSQAPIGRNMNSNPVTYLGIWDKIRRLFSEQPEARQQNFTAGHFSFNSKGACSACGGSGREKIWLGGNSFLHNTCTRCHGKKYDDRVLSVRYKGKSIFEILEMSVTEAVTFFEDSPGVISTLKVMERIGMGYIELGQPTPTLSGGEAQRIKLAREIGKRRKGHILYVLDEPTAGLSLYDTAKLIRLLDELAAKGNSVIVIEHDTDVLSWCDWIIEMGPGGGAAGGRVIAEGTPGTLNENPESITGRYLTNENRK